MSQANPNGGQSGFLRSHPQMAKAHTPGNSDFEPLQLRPGHHRHTLDHSYFPEGNEDMNNNTLFPIIPDENNDYADRIYADPYRRNLYIFDRNGREMFFEEEEQGLVSPNSKQMTGKFISLF